jgi:hypothetical protein
MAEDLGQSDQIAGVVVKELMRHRWPTFPYEKP